MRRGLGAILYQEQEGHKRVIAYASRGLTKSEQYYPAHRLELLALKWAVTDKFSDYLMTSKFIAYTDNYPPRFFHQQSWMPLLNDGLLHFHLIILKLNTDPE